ncbi:MAG: hypothetical protein JST54_12585 [Deltaproteobacteria bacterium]|nr:hypothetical protein [Deltaproteobacteria bacterium]
MDSTKSPDPAPAALADGERYLRALEASVNRTVKRLSGLGIPEGSAKALVAGHVVSAGMVMLMGQGRTDEEIIGLLLPKLAQVRAQFTEAQKAQGIEPKRIVTLDEVH